MQKNLKVITKPDCENSPNKSFLRDLSIAFANGDVDFITQSVSDDIHWNIVGGKSAKGKSDFIDLLEKMKSDNVSEIILDFIITYGKEAAVSGLIIMNNDNKFSFADLYTFCSTDSIKVQSIRSYIIQI